MDRHLSNLQTSGLSVSRADTDRCLSLTAMYDEIYALVVNQDRLSGITWDSVPFDSGTVLRGHLDGYTILKHNDHRYDISVPATHPLCLLVYQAISTSFQGCFSNYLKTNELRYAVGLLPVIGIAPDGPWHRDSASCEQSYLTTFLYLNEDSDAYTEILVNSHLDTRFVHEVLQEKSYISNIVGRDIIIGGFFSFSPIVIFVV